MEDLTRLVALMEGPAFVLAVNQAELANSVRALYGSDFGAHRYLGRFIGLTYPLPEPDLTRFIEGWVADHGTDWQDLWPPDPAAQRTAAGLAAIAKGLGLYLRDVQQSLAELDVLLRLAPSGVHRCLSPALAFLVMLRRVDRDAYEDYLSERGVATVKLVESAGLDFARSDVGHLVEGGLHLIKRNSDERDGIVRGLESMQAVGVDDAKPTDERRRANEWIRSDRGEAAAQLVRLRERMGLEGGQDLPDTLRGLLGFTASLRFPSTGAGSAEIPAPRAGGTGITVR